MRGETMRRQRIPPSPRTQQAFVYFVGRCGVCFGDVWTYRKHLVTVVDSLLCVCERCRRSREETSKTFPVVVTVRHNPRRQAG